MERQPNTIYVASISYGKDSIAMLEAIKRLGYPLDRIISAQVWATDTIPADLPEMYAWKGEADKKIFERYGIQVERVCAYDKHSVGGQCLRRTYERQFYTILQKGKYVGTIKGFPQTIGGWCKKLKYEYFNLRKDILSKSDYSWGGEWNTYGFPTRKGNWCNGMLKATPLDREKKSTAFKDLGGKGNGCSSRLKTSVFGFARERRAKNKYRSIYRNCG